MNRKQAVEAVTWFLNQFDLQAWSVKLFIQPTKPPWLDDVPDAGEWCGACHTRDHNKQARIWVSSRTTEQAKADCDRFDNDRLYGNPYMTLFHECGHILLVNMGVSRDECNDAELMVTNLGRICAALYLGGSRGQSTHSPRVR